VSAEIVDTIFENVEVDSRTVFYDLCSGSGAVTIELINHGVDPSQIVMVDISSWAAFWSQIGAGSFDIDRLDVYLSQIPEDKHLVKDFMTKLSDEDAAIDEAYKYILLQASSFGGKQIWREGHVWKNAFFRSYWEPKEGCVRTSPANPIQPSPSTLRKRVSLLANYCRGLRVVRCDIREFTDFSGSGNSVLYMDPPYRGTTGYGFDFDLQRCISNLRETLPSAPFFVSEGYPFASEAYHLNFKGAKGGISGNRRGKHEEWLNVIE
jgi:site-specific DNA-adenine methylase